MSLTHATIARAANLAGRSSRRSGAPRLTETSRLDTLIAWLSWNDPNGAYSDEQTEIEGIAPLTLEDAWELVEDQVKDWIAEAGPGARANPLSIPAEIAIGAGVAIVGVSVLGYVLAKAIGGAVASGIGSGILNPKPAPLALSSTDRKSVQLSTTAASNYGLSTTLDVVFAPGATFEVTPQTGVVNFERTATGLRVVAVGSGSALLTVSYPPDTTGKSDAIVSIGVV